MELTQTLSRLFLVSLDILSLTFQEQSFENSSRDTQSQPRSESGSSYFYQVVSYKHHIPYMRLASKTAASEPLPTIAHHILRSNDAGVEAFDLASFL